MANIGNNILTAVSTVINSEIQKLKFDKTVEATVVKISNTEIGEYQVKYEGNIVLAYSEDLKTVYDVNDTVLVKIPEGDMTKKKIISGKVDNTKTYTDTTNLSNYVIPVGPTFEQFYTSFDPSNKYGLIAGVAPYEFLIYDSEEEESKSRADKLFQGFSKGCGKIKVSADFSTQFKGSPVKGDYGIKLIFQARDYTEEGIETVKDVSFILDLTSFSGNPYNYNNFNPQSAILDVQTDYLLSLKQIIFFQKEFVVDEWVVPEQDSKGEWHNVTKRNTTDPNIFVRNINLQFVEITDLLENLYVINIEVPKGISLVKTGDVLPLIGQLYYSGKSIMDKNTCECRWYKEDASITIGSPNYDKNAGVGWKRLTENINFNTINIYYDDVPYETRYKLVVIYNKENVFNKITTVQRYNSNYDFAVVQDTEVTDIVLSIKNNKDTKTYFGNWYQLLPDGSYSLISKNKNKIAINSYLIYTIITFYVEIFDDDGNIICTLNKALHNTDSQDNVTVTYIGSDMYQYDVNGDITIDNAETEKTLTAALVWADGYGSAYTTTWLAGDGHALSTSQKYNPYNSMLQGMYIDEYNVLHYLVKQKFNKKYNNNNVILRVTTVDNHVYEFKKELLFFKDGDQGTNGTTYVCAIRPCNAGRERLNGFYPLVYDGEAWKSYQDAEGNNIYLRAWVYKDGEIINDNSNYELTFKWSGDGGINVIRRSDYGDTAQIIGSSAAANVFAAKVEITIKDYIGSDPISLYYTYPLDVAFGDIDLSLFGDVSLPNLIEYSTSGINATFIDSKLEVVYDTIDYANTFISLNEKILKIITLSMEKHIKPASAYIGEEGLGSIKCSLGEDKYLIHTIIPYINTYGNEAINGWDGTRLETNDGYVLAPQIGAGEKDSFNQFTGVVMGKDTAQNMIGLYGYQNGVTSFGLKKDGTAFFGQSIAGGRITIDGTSGEISGGNGGIDANGMTIKLANKNESVLTKAIQIGNNNFYVTYGGNIHSQSGDIGGWNINNLSLYKNSTFLYAEDQDSTKVIGGSTAKNDWRITSGLSFGVDKNGNLYANSGLIGGWNINADTLTSTGIQVTTLYAKNQSESREIGGSGPRSDWRISVGSVFGVDSAGGMYATTGTIAGWYISPTSIYNKALSTTFAMDGPGRTWFYSDGPGQTTLASGGSQYDISTNSISVTGTNSYIEGANIKNLAVENLTVGGVPVQIGSNSYITAISGKGRRVEWTVHFAQVVTDINTSTNRLGYIISVTPVKGLSDWKFTTVESIDITWSKQNIKTLNAGARADGTSSITWYY